jgi:hypothetical protein
VGKKETARHMEGWTDAPISPSAIIKAGLELKAHNSRFE